MSRFKVGDRVRVKWANTPEGRRFVGKEGAVEEVYCDENWPPLYGLDISPITQSPFDGRLTFTGWRAEQLEPATDSYDVASWDTCIWKPEHLRVKA